MEAHHVESENTKVTWGNFLPERIRQLLLNMSRYFFDNLLAADSHDPYNASENFFKTLKVNSFYN